MSKMLGYKVWHPLIHNMGEFHGLFNDRFKIKVSIISVYTLVNQSSLIANYKISVT